MKKLFIFLAFILGVSFLNQCKTPEGGTNHDVFGEQPPQVKLLIPVKITSEGETSKIATMFSHRFYHIANSQENQKHLELIQSAIENEWLLMMLFSPNTDEIIFVQRASQEQETAFRSKFTQTITENETPLKPIIENEEKLNELITKIKNEACSFTKAYPCIPFNYPVDGCYARAHKMRQILAQNGYDCQKIFIYGDLNARYDAITPERGGCCVAWSYHTSVLVKFKDDNQQVTQRIIDLSFSEKALLVETWKGLSLNDSCGKSSLNDTQIVDGNVYYRSPKGTLFYDDTYQHTDCVLQIFSQVSGCYLPAPSTASCDF